MNYSKRLPSGLTNFFAIFAVEDVPTIYAIIDLVLFPY